MLKKALVLTALAFAFVSPAQAFNCPSQMAAIDAALPDANLSDADKAKVMELRQQGEEQHKAGQHAESVKTLNEAKEMLGL